MMQKLYAERDTILTPHIQALGYQGDTAQVEHLYELEIQLQANAERAQNLVGFMSKGYLSPVLFTEQMNELEAEATELRKNISALSTHHEATPLSEAETLYAFLAKNGANLETFDDDIFTTFVESIAAIARDEVSFQLKCGLSLNQQFKREKRKSPNQKT